jgi:hypothetical protein
MKKLFYEESIMEKFPRCIVCEQDSQQVPLLAMKFRQNEIWICPQHLPIMIHQPAKLADKLPGIEQIKPAESHDHH